MAQAAVHRAREASLRLAQILDTNRPVATRVWKPALGMIGAFSMVCLAAAAARTPVRRGSITARWRAVPIHVVFGCGQPAFASILVTVGDGDSRGIADRWSSSPGKTAGGRPENHSMPGHMLSRPLDASLIPLGQLPPDERGTTAATRSSRSAQAQDREVAPEFRTLVFIEATQYRTSDSSVWRVQVWRVTLVSPVSRTVGESACGQFDLAAKKFFATSNYIISCTRRNENEDVDGTL